MKSLSYRSVLGLALVFLCCFAAQTMSSSTQKALSVLESMQQAIAATQHMRYQAQASERLRDGSMRTSHIYVKVKSKPYQAYFRTIAPKKGIELLYRPHLDGTKVLINPNGFPWINVKLDIQSKRLREGHHSVDRAGMGYFGRVIQKGIRTAQQQGSLDNSLTYAGLESFDGVPCHKIVLNNEEFTQHSYTVKKGEDLNQIAAKLAISEYKILDLNPEINYFNDVSEGDIIAVPSAYGKKIVLHIDTERNLPLSIRVDDEKGFFEAYSFHQVENNPDISDMEWDPSFDAYGF